MSGEVETWSLIQMRFAKNVDFMNKKETLGSQGLAKDLQ